MTLGSTEEKKQWPFKNGWYIKDGQKISQPMFSDPDASGKRFFKGIKPVRAETQQWIF